MTWLVTPRPRVLGPASSEEWPHTGPAPAIASLLGSLTPLPHQGPQRGRPSPVLLPSRVPSLFQALYPHPPPGVTGLRLRGGGGRLPLSATPRAVQGPSPAPTPVCQPQLLRARPGGGVWVLMEGQAQAGVRNTSLQGKRTWVRLMAGNRASPSGVSGAAGRLRERSPRHRGRMGSRPPSPLLSLRALSADGGVEGTGGCRSRRTREGRSGCAGAKPRTFHEGTRRCTRPSPNRL